MGRIYNYKLTVNIPYWTAQLAKIGKTLTAKDKRLLNSVKYEKQDNEAMARIHAKALTNGLYIPCLTDLVGDCMFESIEKTGFCEDRREFRKSVALLMFLFGDCKIISTYDDTLKNIFNMFNEIEYVFCHKMKRVYKYTYYTMCTDMFSDGSWSRLPTEIVLTLISIFFKVRINIYHDNGHINKICDEAVDKALPLDDPSCNINLALIGENHYVPLVPVPHKDTVSLKCPKYTIKLKKFLKWAQEKADVIGLYEDVDDDMDSAISDSDSDSDSESDKDHKESQQDDDSSHSTSSSNGSRSKSSGSNTASPRSKLIDRKSVV